MPMPTLAMRYENPRFAPKSAVTLLNPGRGAIQPDGITDGDTRPFPGKAPSTEQSVEQSI